ncbi:MAG: isoprenylcysteine carboxylmethyltransferase family protein [Desulfatibacillum sp.]|nr:isoprenylcysteine carboxylmethyltransferase family protein [Desulfatibacillum sp.]
MEEKLTKKGARSLRAPIRWTLIMAIVFFLAAGRLDIPRAWLAFGIHLMGGVLGALIMAKLAPGLANRRASLGEGTKAWDKIILLVYFLMVLVASPLVAGLEAGRLAQPRLGLEFEIIGIVFYLVFFVIVHWAMLTNRHFESSSRIQKDREHQVITQGPYRFVRHPGYVAMILTALADPLIIGTAYALIPAGCAVIAVIVRTALEDRMLQNELEGYAAYAQKTRSRLIPGIW